MKQLTIILLLTSFLANPNLLAQDKCVLHCNKSFYVTGEVIWYKLYLSKQFLGSKALITVTVSNSEGKFIHQSQLIPHSANSVFGHYKIPYDSVSDLYHLTFHATREEHNEPILLIDALVPIYNDFEQLGIQGKGDSLQGDFSMDSITTSNDLQIEISTDKNQYTPREKMTIVINVRDENGQAVNANLSVTINDEVLTLVDHALFSTIKSGNDIPEISVWEEDIPIRGTLLHQSDNPIHVKGMVGSYLSSLGKILYFQSDQTGQFSLDLPLLNGNFPVHFKSYWPENLKVKIVQNSPIIKSRRQLPVLPAVDLYLENSRKRKAIYQISGEVESKMESSYRKNEYEAIVPAKSYLLDEYDPFPDFYTLAKELFLPMVIKRSKEGEYSIKLFNPKHTIRIPFPSTPLFIIDGQITQDQNYFATQDMEKIASIHLYSAPQQLKEIFGPLGRFGVLEIRSREGAFSLPDADSLNYHQFSGLQAEVVYPIQVSAGILRLQPALYWAPNLETDDRGELRLEIPLSDDISKFQIEVVGQSKAGRRGHATQSFEVVFRR